MGYLADMVRQLKEEQEVIFVGTGVLLINNQNQILIGCRSDNNEWCIPGGSLEVGENLVECAARELYEETGIIVDKSDLHLNSAEVLKKPIIKNGRRIHVVSISYWANKYNDIDFEIDSREYTKYAWLSREEIEALDNITEYTKLELAIYWRSLEK